jgi:cytochrome c oxidase assembly protein subunit 11
MKRNNKILILLLAVVVGMFVFGYANVPLFKRFCSAIGIGLSPNSAPEQKTEEVLVDKSRPLKVLFTTTVNDDLPIMFDSEKKSSNIFVGESDKNNYHFVNLSNDTLYFRPVHSVFPAAASKRYTMTECFCFKDMMLLPHEDVSVPLVYYFKPELNKEVTRVTMHYTLFKREITDEEISGVKDFKVSN